MQCLAEWHHALTRRVPAGSKKTVIHNGVHRTTLLRVSLTEEFDPWPMEYRNTATSLLPAHLDDVHGESLGVLLLFDPLYYHETVPASDTCVPDMPQLKETVAAYKDSLRLPAENFRTLNRTLRSSKSSHCDFRSTTTTSQLLTLVTFFTASPLPLHDVLVASIMQPHSFSSAATEGGNKTHPWQYRNTYP